MSETYKREIPVYEIVLQYAYESQGYKGDNGEVTFNPMSRFVSIHDNYTPGGLPLRVDIDHVARRAQVAKTGSYWDLNETEKPTANALILATPGGALTYVLPSEFAPYVHNHDERYYTQAQVTSFLAGKSNTGHNHDERYYTESEIDWLLGFKSNDGHAHDERYYTESEIDSMFSGIESLWTDAGSEYRTDTNALHMNNVSTYKHLMFSSAGSKPHGIYVDHNQGFSFLSHTGNDFVMNSATGVFTTPALNAGSISYPTAPPASDKLILVSASGATSYIDATGSYTHLTDKYVPMKSVGTNALENSLFYLGPKGMVTHSLLTVSPTSGLSAGVLGNTVYGAAIAGESSAGPGGTFRSMSNIGAIIETETGPYALLVYGNSGVGLKVSNGGAQITGTTEINGITYPAADGSPGQFLQTDGAGNIVFATIGTGITGTFNFASYTGITVEAGRITSIF